MAEGVPDWVEKRLGDAGMTLWRKLHASGQVELLKTMEEQKFKLKSEVLVDVKNALSDDEEAQNCVRELVEPINSLLDDEEILSESVYRACTSGGSLEQMVKRGMRLREYIDEGTVGDRVVLRNGDDDTGYIVSQPIWCDTRGNRFHAGLSLNLHPHSMPDFVEVWTSATPPCKRDRDTAKRNRQKILPLLTLDKGTNLKGKGVQFENDFDDHVTLSVKLGHSLPASCPEEAEGKIEVPTFESLPWRVGEYAFFNLKARSEWPGWTSDEQFGDGCVVSALSKIQMECDSTDLFFSIGRLHSIVSDDRITLLQQKSLFRSESLSIITEFFYSDEYDPMACDSMVIREAFDVLNRESVLFFGDIIPSFLEKGDVPKVKIEDSLREYHKIDVSDMEKPCSGDTNIMDGVRLVKFLRTLSMDSMKEFISRSFDSDASPSEALEFAMTCLERERSAISPECCRRFSDIVENKMIIARVNSISFEIERVETGQCKEAISLMEENPLLSAFVLACIGCELRDRSKQDGVVLPVLASQVLFATSTCERLSSGRIELNKEEVGVSLPVPDEGVHIGIIDSGRPDIGKIVGKQLGSAVFKGLRFFRSYEWGKMDSFIFWFISDKIPFNFEWAYSYPRKGHYPSIDEGWEWASRVLTKCESRLKDKGILVEEDVSIRVDPRDKKYFLLVCWDRRFFYRALAAARKMLARTEVVKDPEVILELHEKP